MAKFTIFIIACALAAAAPFWSAEKASNKNAATLQFMAFPAEFDGAPLKELSLSKNELSFMADFPGKFGRFTDGRREIIFRFVTEATRKLHPSRDCFAAIGYRTRPLPLRVDAAGNRWGCFAAAKNEQSLRVCERIYNLDNSVQWTDVSAWYWSALAARNGEWLAVTVAETANTEH